LIVRHEVGIAVARADMLDDAVRHGEIEFLHLGIKPRHVLAEAGMDEAAHLGKRIVEPTARLESPGIVAELAQGRDRMAHAAADIEHPDRGRLAPRKVAAQQWRNEAARKTLAAEESPECVSCRRPCNRDPRHERQNVRPTLPIPLGAARPKVRLAPSLAKWIGRKFTAM